MAVQLEQSYLVSDVGDIPVTALPLTVCCWYKIVTTPSAGTVPGLVSLCTSTSSQNYWAMTLLHTSNSAVRAFSNASVGDDGTAESPALTQDAVDDIVGGNPASSGQWFHAAAVFTSNSSRTAYHNGLGTTDTTTSDILTVTPNRVGIGALVDASESGQFIGTDGMGYIAEVGVWDAALTAAQVAELASGRDPANMLSDNLVAHWRLKDGYVDRVGSITMTPVTGAGEAPVIIDDHPPLFDFNTSDDIPVAAPATLIPFASTWKYYKGSADNGEPGIGTWFNKGYDDTGPNWLSGVAPFGSTVGGNYELTPTTELTNHTSAGTDGYNTVFYRHDFTVTDASAVTNLRLKIRRGHGFIAYINGTEIARGGMTTAQAPLIDDLSDGVHINYWSTYDLGGIGNGALEDGDNVLAVHVLNQGRTVTTFFFEASLEIYDLWPKDPVLVSPTDGQSTGVETQPILRVTGTDQNDQKLTVKFYGRRKGNVLSAGSDWTFVHIPDTQIYTTQVDDPGRMEDQYQWIRDNLVAENIKFAAHVGDIVDTSTTAAYPGTGDVVDEWGRANAGLDILETNPVIPYSVLPGNHDGAPHPQNMRVYDGHIPVSRYESYAWFGDAYQSPSNTGKRMHAHYEYFSANDIHYIVLNIPWMIDPDGDLLQWGENVLLDNMHRQAIIVTHFLVSTDSNLDYDQGSKIFRSLMRLPNVFMFLSGHVTGSNVQEYERQFSWNGVQKDVLAANYQDETNGGNGYLRLMKFKPATDTIDVTAYSPTLGESLTNPEAGFVSYTNLSVPFTISNVKLKEENFSYLGETTIVSGGTTDFIWEQLGGDPLEVGTEYEWFAVLSNGTRFTPGSVVSLTPDRLTPGPSTPVTETTDGITIESSPTIAGRRYHTTTTTIVYTDRGATVTQTTSDFDYLESGKRIVNNDASEIDKQVTVNTDTRVEEPNTSKIDSNIRSVTKTSRGATLVGSQKVVKTARGATVYNN